MLIEIRYVDPEDYGRISKISKKAGLDIIEKDEVEALLGNEGIIGTEILYDGRIVGFLIYYAQNPFLIIEHISILPRYQRRGLGTELICRLFRCKGREAIVAFVPSENSSAIHFFESLEFFRQNTDSSVVTELHRPFNEGARIIESLFV